MILSSILISGALAILLALLYVEARRHGAVNRLEDLSGRTRPVDLEAFRNLVDPEEENFLRSQFAARRIPRRPEKTHAGGPDLYTK